MAQFIHRGAIKKTPINSPGKSHFVGEVTRKLEEVPDGLGLLDGRRKKKKKKPRTFERKNINNPKDLTLQSEGAAFPKPHLFFMAQVTQKGAIKKTTTNSSHKPQETARHIGEDHDDGGMWKRRKRKQRKFERRNTNEGKDVTLQNEEALFPRARLSHEQMSICEDEHIRVVIREGKKQELQTSFLCRMCQFRCTEWDVIQKHIDTKGHKELWEVKADERSCRLLPNPMHGQLVIISNLLFKLAEEFGINMVNRVRRQMIASRIGDLLRQHIPGCSIQLYGSSKTGMGLSSSDVNLNLHISPGINIANVVAQVHRILDEDVFCLKPEILLSSDVPMVVFHDASTQWYCIITWNMAPAVELAELLAKFDDLDERVHYLAAAFRLWANMCQLDRVASGTLPPHAFSLLVVYYLQQLEEPVLPDVQEIVKFRSTDTEDPKCDRNKWKSFNTSSVGHLWLGLLRFYALDFAVSDIVVSIQSRRPTFRSWKKWSGRRIAIEDPFLPKRNLSKYMVNMASFQYFMHCLQSTYKYFATPQSAQGPIFHRIQMPLRATRSAHHFPIDRNSFLEIISSDERFKDEDVDNSSICKKLENVNLTDANARDGKSQMKNKLGSQQNINHEIHHLIVTPQQADIMYKKFNTNYFLYSFKPEMFTGGKELPTICILCHKEGHTRATCPEEEQPPLPSLPPLSPAFVKVLDSVCHHISKSMGLRTEDYHVRQRLVADLEDFINAFFPGTKLTTFGSSCNGFGLRKSDVDICMTFGYRKQPEELDIPYFIQQLHAVLKHDPNLENLIPITTAKVPILKFYHVPTRLEGDICLYNVLGQESTRLMKTYCEIDNRVKILGHLMKVFTKLCDISDASRGSLSSYAYILMVIYFLQQCEPPVVPVLQELSPSGQPPVRMVDKCNTYFYEDIRSLPVVWPAYGKNKKTVAELWLELLCFYTETFNYDCFVVCVRRRRPLQRFEKLWASNQIAIEDPFDVGHNLGVALSRRMHDYIIRTFRNARNHFGLSRDIPKYDKMPSLVNFFLDKEKFSDGFAPYKRGCQLCKKIGHTSQNCPSKKKYEKDASKWFKFDDQEYCDDDEDVPYMLDDGE